MHSKLLGLSLVTGLMSATAFAEPAIQPGDSLESLSKVKVTTTVNGQAGSIQDLVASGQIRIVDASQIAADPAQAGSETQVQTSSAVDANAPETAPADINTTAQTTEASQVASETEVQNMAAADETAPQATEMNTTAQAAEVAPEQANAPALEQSAQAASENVDPMQPNAELAAQQAEQVMDQETAAQAPVNETSENIAAAPMASPTADTSVNAADMSQSDVTSEAVAAAPVNTAETGMNNEAFAAAPETAQPTDAVQAAPEADINDAPVNASPEAPAAEQTEN
ncbi:MAG: hypothetical protein ACN6NJ_14385 [Acinetobacter sp.]